MANIQKYLDSSLEVLKRFGFLDKAREESQLANILNDLIRVDEASIVNIAKTVRYIGAFSDLVREKVEDVNVSDRYTKITESFNSLREDSRRIIEQLADGKINAREKASNIWMRLTRGTTHERFEKIEDVYHAVSKDTREQLENEDAIMNAYIDFRFALKEAEILSQGVLAKQTKLRETVQGEFNLAAQTVDSYEGQDAAQKSRLELERDEKRREFEDEDKRYQLIKDVTENLSMGYNVGETLVAKLKQTHDIKDQVYRRAVTFFTTNEHVFTTLDAVYTSQRGLHETTQTLEAMKEGANKGLEDVAELGRNLERAALKAGYGSTYNPESVKKLVDSIVSYQEESIQTINQLRAESAKNTKEIERIVEDGKRRTREAIVKYASQSQA